MFATVMPWAAHADVKCDSSRLALTRWRRSEKAHNHPPYLTNLATFAPSKRHWRTM
jgi:hypothetical protein